MIKTNVSIAKYKDGLASRIIVFVLLVLINIFQLAHAELNVQQQITESSDNSSDNNKNVALYCEQLPEAQRNTMEVVYEGDCIRAFYKLMYGVDRLDIEFSVGKEYDLTPLCEFSSGFKRLGLDEFEGVFPECFKHIEGIRFLYLDTRDQLDLSDLPMPESLIGLFIYRVKNINGVLNTNKLEMIKIKVLIPLLVFSPQFL